jgi:hypothetical protein
MQKKIPGTWEPLTPTESASHLRRVREADFEFTIAISYVA